MIVTDLSTSYNPVPKNERKKNKKIIDEKKHNCEFCGKKNCWTNKHHIKSKGSGGDDIEDNLIELCSNCHVKAHSGEISKQELIKIVKRRKRK